MAGVLEILERDASDDGAKPKRKRKQVEEVLEENENIPNDIPPNRMAPPTRKKRAVLSSPPRIPVESSGLHQNPVESTGLHWTESTEIHQNPVESTGLSPQSTGLYNS